LDPFTLPDWDTFIIACNVLSVFPSIIYPFVDQILIVISSLVPLPTQPVKPVPVALEMDEESQLQLALSLSKEEHQQVGFVVVTGGGGQLTAEISIYILMSLFPVATNSK